MSNNEFSGESIGGTAAENLTAYRFVNITTATAADKKFSIADSGDIAIGIVGETITSGDPVNAYIDGTGYLEVDGGTAVSAGDKLKPHTDSSGKGLKTTTDTDEYCAIALEDSSADGDIILVLIRQGMVAA